MICSCLATELVHGHDPVICSFDCAAMRSHLLASLEAGHVDQFPCTKIRRVPFGSRVRKTSKELFTASAVCQII